MLRKAELSCEADSENYLGGSSETRRRQLPMPPSDCFGTGREHKLDLLCGLFGVLDCKWMSGPAGSRDHQPRGTGAQTEIPAKSIARSHERAKESCAFLLTKTYMDAG